MRRPDLADLSVFVMVAERRSFAQAAIELGMSRSRVSELVRALEERLGVRLLNRTTRSVAPTDAGEQLLGQLRPALRDLDAALDSISAFRETPAGLLRLTVPPPVAKLTLAPLLGRFLTQYPHISLEISAEASMVDIVAENFDAGIRPDDRVARDMIAVPLGRELRGVVVAAPSYLERWAVPATPKDLKAHECIRLRLPNGALLPWPFERDGRHLEAEVSGRLIVNDLDVATSAALGGAGVLYTAREYVAPHIASGQLVPVLEAWRSRSATLFLYYPSRRLMPPRLRAMVEFLRANLPKSGDQKNEGSLNRRQGERRVHTKRRTQG